MSDKYGRNIFQIAQLDGKFANRSRRRRIESGSWLVKHDDFRVADQSASDPDAPREVFHTAVVSVDGHIAKLDVSYDSELDWRFDERAAAVSGTLQVRRRDA